MHEAVEGAGRGRRLLVLLGACAVAMLVGGASADAATITVNSNADTVGNDGSCILREAITAANTDTASGMAAGECGAGSGADDINFSIGTGLQTITVTGTPLSQITSQVTIDGTTQPSTPANTPGIALNGGGAGVVDPVGPDDALRFGTGSANSVVRGLIIGNAAEGGVRLDGGSVTVELNWIGTNSAGTAAPSPNATDGIVVNSANNVIGGSSAAQQNVISGHNGMGDRGVLLTGIASGTQLKGNLIGTNAAGSAAVANHTGVESALGSASTTIGGTLADDRNVISGNTTDGIRADSSDVTIQGNLIGTNAAGTAALGNGLGVYLLRLVGSNSLGAPGAGNVISGNGTGVRVEAGALSATLSIKSNLIGTSADGMSAIGHVGQGIRFDNVGIPVAIGGAAAGEGNVIAASRNEAIRLGFAPGGVTVLGNLIGTDAAGGGSQALFGNGQLAPSILVAGSNTQNVRIGGTAAGEGNIIANTQLGFDAVSVENDVGSGNRIQGNRVFGNGGLGIDLAGPADLASGVTPNDALDADAGPMGLGLQNFPLITSASRDASVVNVAGTLDSEANGTYSIDLFANTSCDQSGNGEGEFYLGSTAAVTDGTGIASFNVSSLPTTSPAGAMQITATATETSTAEGDSSEFSPCFAASQIPGPPGPPAPPPPPVVTPIAATTPVVTRKRCKKGRKLKRGKCVKKKKK